ncbi:MAG: hypothetical protein IPH13_17700 [Planctomycetes bacterium]|nr:hypothetical protein [Planctomycetota bacterium]
MTAWSAPLRAEICRTWFTRSTWGLVFAPAVVAMLRIVGGRIGETVEQAQKLAAGAAANSADVVNGFGPLADGMRAGAAVLALLLLVQGATTFVRDRDSGVLGQWYVATPRTLVVLARVIGVLSWLLPALLALVAVAAAVAHGIYGLTDIVEEGDVMATANELWIDVAKGVVGVIPGLLTCAVFGIAVSALASSAGGAVGGTLVPFILFDVLRALLPNGAKYVFVTYVPFLGEGSTLSRLTDIARAYSDAVWNVEEFERAWTIPGAQALVLILLTILACRVRPA